MIFSNVVARQVVFSKVGEFFSGGWLRTNTPPHIRGTEVEVPKTGDSGGVKAGNSSGQKAGEGGKTDLDQNYIDKQVGKFEGSGQATGHRENGAASTETPVSPERAQYIEAQKKKWQAEQDAKKRDQLFNQATPGQIDGKAPEPFSQSGLEESVEAVVKAGKEGRALPLRTRHMAKTAGITAAITVPLTVGATLVTNVILELLKPKINPQATPATEQHVLESRLVDNAQRNVFLLMNTLVSLNSKTEKGVEPSVEWLAKTNDERMDYLDEMLDYLEVEFAKLAGKNGPDSQCPKLGEQGDDIKRRATGVETRVAYIKGLLDVVRSQQK
jgi:hypothetical protein